MDVVFLGIIGYDIVYYLCIGDDECFVAWCYYECIENLDFFYFIEFIVYFNLVIYFIGFE